MLKKMAVIVGAVFLLIGILGFIPGITTQGEGSERLLLGIFEVGGMHNFIHILSGLAALAASKGERYAKYFFRIFGIVYALVTVIGFMTGNTVLGLFHVNTADNFLHLFLALLFLYLGFMHKPAMRAANEQES